MTDAVLKAGGLDIAIGNPEKLMFKSPNISKLELAKYYLKIADVALPHYRKRALTMHRYPDGIGERGFFQKHIADYFPDWIDRATLPKEGGEVTSVVANNTATLVYLADQACITPHLALSRTDRHNHPDRMIFDLDPSDDDFGKVRTTATHLKTLLDRLGLVSFVQTTGSRGLHVLVPLDRKADFQQVRAFSHRVCRKLAEQHADLMTIEQRRNMRGTRVFLDDLRNGYGQTAVAPYAVRALQGAPIATPLKWDEVGCGNLTPRKYHMGNILRRLGQTDDPWADLARYAQGLDRAERRIACADTM
ncbi:non-homologous end-joining DNA ligase [Marinobacter sp. HL-58]|uniref:non-homologous end-joining DNA ligase n=1 Tax=Marinobacter sp. HL-58 TaxID=1479237 RepID=UPI00047FBFAE|nr:non-homologous end-joining DNA ligase [Marinobacter sp. HL-58]KPP98877.1 MAG: DNA ligase (ATP) [Marinobacter sp. HL-58]